MEYHVLLLLLLSQSAYGRSRQITDPTRPCEELAFRLGQQLMYEVDNPSPTFLHGVTMVLRPADGDDFLNNEPFVCSFEGITSLSDLKLKLIENDNLFPLFKTGYAALVYDVQSWRQRFLTAKEAGQGWTNRQVETLMIAAAEAVEATGILSLYPAGRDIREDILYPTEAEKEKYGLGDYTPVPLSTDPLDKQCRDVAQKLKAIVDLYQSYGYFNMINDLNNKFLGLKDFSEDSVYSLVCPVIEGAKDFELMGLLISLDGQGVINRLLTSGYVAFTNQAYTEGNYLWSVLSGSSYSEYSEDELTHYKERDAFWEAVRAMNLLDLEEDLPLI